MQWLSGLMKSVGIVNPWALLPYLVGIPAIFLAGAWWDGDQRQRAVEHRVVSGFADYAMYRAIEGYADKKLLVEQLRDERAAGANWMARFERIMDASEQERAAFRTELASSQAKQRQLAKESNEKARALDEAQSQLVIAWRDGRIPAEFNCGVLKSPGCPDLRPLAIPAGSAGGVAVQPQPAGAGAAGGGGVVPAKPADGHDER